MKLVHAILLGFALLSGAAIAQNISTSGTPCVATGGGGGGVPVNTAVPIITGTAQQGQVLSASTGMWTNSPVAFAYQWNSSNGTEISGATNSGYVPQASDVGNTLTVSVVATNPPGATIPPSTSITDGGGNVWTVVGGVVKENGVNAAVSSGVILLVYDNGIIYQENGTGGWWDWNGTAWVAVPSPAATSLPTAAIIGTGCTSCTTALRMNNLMYTLGVSSHVVTDNNVDTITDAQWLGIHMWRDGITNITGAMSTVYQGLANAGLQFIGQAWLPTDTVIADAISGAETVAAMKTGFLYALEGPNEPGNYAFTYNGIATTTSWQGVSQWQSGWVTAIGNAGPLAGVQTWSVSLTGEELGNWGLQYLVVPAGGGGTLAAGGLNYGTTLNEHVYCGYGMASNAYIDPTLGDCFANEMAGGHVTTYLHGYAGYANIATAFANPKGITETGFSDTNSAPANSVDTVTKGKLLLTGWLDSWYENFLAFCIDTFYDEGDGYGVLAGPANPKTSATYIHNFTTPLVDGGGTANIFTPGALNYTIAGMPAPTCAYQKGSAPCAQSQLFQKSNGNFELLIWNNVTDYNFGTKAPITINPTAVTVSFNILHQTVNVYDPTNGATPLNTHTNLAAGSTVTVQLKDYPQIVEVIN